MPSFTRKKTLFTEDTGVVRPIISTIFSERIKKGKRKSLLACLFALSGLVCWCGISQVIGNSVSSAFENAFQIPPLFTTILLVALAAVIVLRKNATIRVLDVMVPVMAVCYLLITLFIIVTNLGALPGVFQRIFAEAFGLRRQRQEGSEP